MEILQNYLLMIWGFVSPWIASLPTWLIIGVVIILVIRCAGAAIQTALKIVIVMLGISFLLGVFGITLPSISDIVSWFQGLLS